MGSLALILLGVLTGVLSALFGIGGGVVLVPALMHAFGMDLHAAAATSLVTLIPTALAGAYLRARLGHVDSAAAALLVAGAMLGLRLGLWGAEVLPVLTIKRLFALVLLGVALRMLLEPS